MNFRAQDVVISRFLLQVMLKANMYMYFKVGFYNKPFSSCCYLKSVSK